MGGSKLPIGLVLLCPSCGSEADIRWCSISVRAYCGECGHWGRVNFGSVRDGVDDWNREVVRAQGEDVADMVGVSDGEA